MKEEMGWNYAQAGWLNTANALGYIIGAILTMILLRHLSAARLFSFGLISTTLALLFTGLNAEMWWQTLWRILAGIFGAMSFSTAGALTAGLFINEPKKNALAIAILFGSGGGLGIVLTGASLPLMLEILGTSAWSMGWILIGITSLLFLPLGLWAALQLKAPIQSETKIIPLPLRQMLPEFAGYAGFGLGYIVYLTFLSAWMTENLASASFITLIWVILGSSICISPFIWRSILTRYASGMPLALILTCIATGSALPVLVNSTFTLLLSALVFGLSVFMAPGAVTNFTRKNLPPESWARAMSLFTVVFAIAQTLGPYGAGLIGDFFNDIGISLLVAAGLLLAGALISLQQKPIVSSKS
jgi:predicted MFS family arabinose efflux permease